MCSVAGCKIQKHGTVGLVIAFPFSLHECKDGRKQNDVIKALCLFHNFAWFSGSRIEPEVHIGFNVLEFVLVLLTD